MADKLKKKFDIIRLNHHYFWFLMALCISSFVYIATDAYSIQGISDSELFTLQSTMVKASSIIVSISMGFLVSLYFNIQKARFGNFKKFAELQEKLVMYQHSFYQLADQLSRNPNIDPRYPTDYKELQRDLEWWQNVEARPWGSWFVRNLREFGVDSWNYSNYDVRGTIMNKEQLIKLSDIISELSSLLARQKYYGQILKDMGLPDNGYDSKLIITDNELIKYPAWRISPDNEKDNWQYLEFWENRINEAYNLIGHMSRISESIYDYKAEVIKVPFIVLMMSTIFGMFIPIFSMAVNFIYPTEYFMTYISIVGFTMCFIMMTIFMYKTVASTEIVGY